jgi:hypothetical protein
MSAADPAADPASAVASPVRDDSHAATLAHEPAVIVWRDAFRRVLGAGMWTAPAGRLTASLPRCDDHRCECTTTAARSVVASQTSRQRRRHPARLASTTITITFTGERADCRTRHQPAP